MVSKPNILILTASYGEGHLQAADALAQAFKGRRDPVRVDVVDFMEMVHPVINSVTRFGYKNSVKYAPKLYGLLYQQTNKIHSNSRLQQLLWRLGARKLLKYIRSTEPAAIINTFPLSGGALSRLIQQGQTDVTSATVITDHAVHSQWIHPYTDFYFVGSDDVKECLIDKGISPERIDITGIPVRRSFHQRYDRQHLKRSFSLDQRPVILIMGGWHGVFDVQLCEQIVQCEKDAQLLIVCGGDRKLFHQIRPLQVRFPDRIRVFGYVSNIPELMTASDFVLTKAGGLTTSEALTMRLPMLLYRPIPGQEEENARFLTREGVACLADDRRQLLELFVQLCRNPERLTRMKERAKQIQRREAASMITKKVLRNVTMHPQSLKAHI